MSAWTWTIWAMTFLSGALIGWGFRSLSAFARASTGERLIDDKGQVVKTGDVCGCGILIAGCTTTNPHSHVFDVARAEASAAAQRRATAEEVRKLARDVDTLTTIGGCGILGCPNKRPHSHVADLVRRMREKQ